MRTRRTDVCWLAVTVACEASEATGAPPAVPVATAAAVTLPASTSSWVTAYAAVQVSVSPGRSVVVAGQTSCGGVPVPEKAVRATSTPVTVVVPVLVTAKVYATWAPAPETTDGLAVVTRTSLDVAPPAVVVAVLRVEETTVAPSRPVAALVRATEPASTSAWVIVYEAVQV